MEINSPTNLWKDYDATALPLNTTALSPKSDNGITVKEYYFDGYTTIDGRVRVYIKILEIQDSKGVVLYMPDMNGCAEDSIVKTLNDSGYTVCVLDYLGISNAERYTLYPQSLVNCNRNGVKLFEIDENRQISNWYIWTCIARRAVTLLNEMYPDKKLFAVGVGIGGSTVYKLATFEDGLTACATLLNILPNVKGTGNALINYRASLDNVAYASLGKLPLFMAISTNDSDGSFDDMADLASDTVSLKVFRIVERAFAGGINITYRSLIDFFQACAENKDVKPRPVITATNSDGTLYFNIERKDENCEILPKIKLYVSFCVEQTKYRNWMNMPTISMGAGKYMTQINVCQESKPIYAFANYIYPDGSIQSSDLLAIVPKALGIKARSPGIYHRKIYDGSMGEDCWTSRDGGVIKVVKGPYDIDAVTSNTNSLVTFKPGDPLFKVPPDTMLQIMACGKPQKLTVAVQDNENTYSCKVDLTGSDSWQKFSLNYMNFKSSVGMLANWSQILLLEFNAEEEFAIGSVLWV